MTLRRSLALAKCRECGREVATSAKTCPGCGVAAPIKGWTTDAKLGGVLIVLVAAQGMNPIYAKVPADGIARRNGSPIDVCAAAVVALP